MDWFTFRTDIPIAEPELDDEGGYGGGQFAAEAPAQDTLRQLEKDGGQFVLRVTADPDDVWLRVRCSNLVTDEAEDDLVFISLGRRNAERLRDALDAALKLGAPGTPAPNE
jgi:hypothetical protein